MATALSFVTLFTLLAVVSGECGIPAIKPNVSRIVGGRDAVPYSWPWHAAVIRIFNGRPKYLCGASVISDRWVLSAAHCFHGSTKHAKYEVRLGIFEHFVDHGHNVRVRSIHIHPRFVVSTLRYDAALLELAEKVSLSDRVSPVCLPSSEHEVPKPNSIAYVTGWGRTSTDVYLPSDTLKQVDVLIYSSDRCRDFYGSYLHSDVMFCAGFDQGGKDSCQGDSGGPLVTFEPVTHRWVQVGVVSWGFGCAQPSLPGVYSRVAKLLSWIDEVIANDGGQNGTRDSADALLRKENKPANNTQREVDVSLEEEKENVPTYWFPANFNVSNFLPEQLNFTDAAW